MLENTPKDVTVILNGFRRPDRLVEQHNAILNQTIPPTQVMYWQNTDPAFQYPTANLPIVAGISNQNLGVWARFAFALNAKTNWICMFDDDTIPGSGWFENCINTQEKTPGLLGTIGVIFPTNNIYHNVHRVGWDNPNEETVPVHCVGHSWFFHRDMLSVFWRELPDMDQPMNVGEDMHFSYCIQKYTPFGTYVPPHPKDNKEMWGSLKGWEYGGDEKATAGQPGAMAKMNATLQKYISKGYDLNKLFNENEL